MIRVLILSAKKLEGFVVDDGHMISYLKEQGHEVTVLPWDDDTLLARLDEGAFDVTVVRTTWDYLERPAQFLKQLEEIEGRCLLLNSCEMIEWNINKVYLMDLESRGVRIVPTHFFIDPNEILTAKLDRNVNKWVLKPSVSANALHTFVLEPNEIFEKIANLPQINGVWMLQPFLEEIKKGEISLHYFNGVFSHGIIKLPKENDFRVQEEHGGIITAYTPQSDEFTFAEYVLAQVGGTPFQARVDFVRTLDGLKLMELELIEPALYFRTNPKSPENFEQALVERVKK